MKRGRWIGMLSAANLALVLGSLLYVILFLGDGNEGEIVCLFKKTFYAYCPGCGGTRAVAALLRLDFYHSFIYNPTVIVTALIFFDIDIRALISIVKNNPCYLKSFNPKVLFIIPAVILVNFAVRNLLLFGFGIDILGDILKR